MNWLKIIFLIPFFFQVSLVHACGTGSLKPLKVQSSCHQEKSVNSHKNGHQKGHKKTTSGSYQTFKSSHVDCPFCLVNACKPAFVLGGNQVEKFSSEKSVSTALFLESISFNDLLLQRARSQVYPPPLIPKPVIANWQSLYSVYLI